MKNTVLTLKYAKKEENKNKTSGPRLEAHFCVHTGHTSYADFIICTDKNIKCKKKSCVHGAGY